MTKRAPVQFDLFEARLARDRRATAEAEHLAYHGAGLTFGELAIGEPFEWAPPIPRGGEPLRKLSATEYGWSRGHGIAEPYYRVQRWTEAPE